MLIQFKPLIALGDIVIPRHGVFSALEVKALGEQHTELTLGAAVD